MFCRNGCTQWHSCSRHCTTSQKVAGSIPDGIIGIFHCLNSSCHTVTLWSTEPEREMHTRDISWGGDKGSQCVVLTTLPTSYTDCLEILGGSTCWSPKGLPRPELDGFISQKHTASICMTLRAGLANTQPSVT